MRARWNGIYTALVPGVAACNATCGQVDTFNDTVSGYGFLCIGGTTGVKATVVTQKWTQACLVAGNQSYKEAAHVFVVPCFVEPWVYWFTFVRLLEEW